MKYEFKGTKGEWTVRPSRKGRKIFIDSDNWLGMFKTYAKIKTIEGFTECPESFENANLIAAAPEMLKALITIYEGRTCDDLSKRLSDTDMGRIAQQAIHKALNINI